MKRYHVCCIFGTRPELIKMAPIIHVLQQMQNQIKTHVVCSGQHRELLYPLVDWFNLNIDVNLEVMQENQHLNSLSSKLISEFGQLYQRENYDCIIAQGDTTTVLMAALAAFYADIPFAHIEAGLRTHNKKFPFPEEMNRVLTGKLASLHFAPTLSSEQNLLNESIDKNTVYITGNTVIDALYYTTKKLNLEMSAHSQEKKSILITVHRRENFGQPLQNICQALLKIAKKYSEVKLVIPVHPNPNVRTVVMQMLGEMPNISLIDPLSYQALVQLLSESYFVVTDSGGIQEEAPALKKPVLVMRDETERPELVELGGARLVGSNEQRIFSEIEQLLTDEKLYKKMIVGYSPYGDGKASQMIADKLIGFLSHSREHSLN